jgi:hypothetical protein
MRHYLSLCAIFKNEAEYLEEWLRFYELVGVEHFYLYNNGSTDGSVKLLQPWIAQGKVSLFPCPVHPGQFTAYSHCIQNFRNMNVWVAFLDLDEFLFSPKQTDLRTLLADYHEEAGVVANWVMFGAAGHQTRPADLVTLSYTRRCELDLCTFEPSLLRNSRLARTEPTSYFPICGHVKSIVNMRDVDRVGSSPHHFRYRDHRTAVSTERVPVPTAISDEIVVDTLRVNHYFSRSWEELNRKLQRGRADGGVPYDIQATLDRNKLFDKVEDLTIIPLAERVKTQML